MGILNTVESMARATAGPEHAKVANALVDVLQQHEGVGGLIQSFQRNGMGCFVEQWAQGQTQPNATAIENGLHGTGLIDNLAERTGLSHGVIRGALAIVVPILIHHMVANNHVTANGRPLGTQPEPDGVRQSILQRI